jgi:hypothetical protein
MARSKESIRQNKAMRAILRGETPEKRIVIAVCFDCVLEMENKLRIDGKYESYEKRKVLQNRLSWVEDMIQGIEEWKKEGDVTFLNQNRPDGYSVDEEKWSQDPEQIKTLTDEAMAEMNKIKSEVEAELSKYI